MKEIKLNDFYEQVGEILGKTQAEYGTLYQRRTRWNNRSAGRGRFDGFGIVRDFGTCVHVALTYPIKINKVFSNQNEALEGLTKLCTDTPLRYERSPS